MLVGERMSKPVISVPPTTPIQEALNMMRRERVRRFPVVTQDGKLVGIVSQSDLLHASPSDATSLSIWELNYLISRIKVEDVMTHDVLTVTNDTPVETAARIMADSKIGGMPVMRDGHVVGMITETDLFKIFLEMLGARYAGVRLTVLIPNIPGELAKITSSIHGNGGNIISLTTALGDSTETGLVTIKVEGIGKDQLRSLVEPFVDEIVDIRETESG
ncbi:MAG: CBS and ACT domain-containing protein [Anaerolineales bacterium]